MARGKQSELKDGQDSGVMKLIKFDQNLIEDSQRKVHCQLDDYVGIIVDKNENYELFKIKQTTVTEDNIKSTTNLYGDKYKIGDTYQEWVSMDKYLQEYKSAAKCYANMRNVNEISKLKYCKDINKLIEIQKETNEILERFAMENTVPKVIKDLNNAYHKLAELESTISKYEEMTTNLVSRCDELISIVEEKRAKMVSKGIIEKKERKHKNVEEKE